MSPRKNSRQQTDTKNKQNRTSYPLRHALMEDTTRHNIAQMTSSSKVYIPCLHFIIIKCHMIT